MQDVCCDRYRQRLQVDIDLLQILRILYRAAKLNEAGMRNFDFEQQSPSATNDACPAAPAHIHSVL